jgi:hypothetical protein
MNRTRVTRRALELKFKGTYGKTLNKMVLPGTARWRGERNGKK